MMRSVCKERCGRACAAAGVGAISVRVCSDDGAVGATGRRMSDACPRQTRLVRLLQVRITSFSSVWRFSAS